METSPTIKGPLSEGAVSAADWGSFHMKNSTIFKLTALSGKNESRDNFCKKQETVCPIEHTVPLFIRLF